MHHRSLYNLININALRRLVVTLGISKLSNFLETTLIQMLVQGTRRDDIFTCSRELALVGFELRSGGRPALVCLLHLRVDRHRFPVLVR